MAHLFIIVVLSLINFEMIFGHGMMVDPPNRSSLWRYGFDVEEHYTDMGLNCGGAGVSSLGNEERNHYIQIHISRKINDVRQAI